MPYCRICGRIIEDDSFFCGNCGTPVKREENQIVDRQDNHLESANEKVTVTEIETDDSINVSKNEALRESGSVSADSPGSDPKIIKNELDSDMSPAKHKTNKGLIIAVVALSAVLFSTLMFVGVFYVKYLKISDHTDDRHFSPEEICAFFRNNGAHIQTLEDIKSSFDSEDRFHEYMWCGEWMEQEKNYLNGLCLYVYNTEDYEHNHSDEIRDNTSKEAIFCGEKLFVISYEFDNERIAKELFDDDTFTYSNHFRRQSVLASVKGSRDTQNGIDYCSWRQGSDYRCLYRDGKYVLSISTFAYGEDENDPSTVLDKIVSLCEYFELPVPS